MTRILIVVAIISIIVGILLKAGVPFKSPLDLSPLAYLRFANTLLLLAISITCLQLRRKSI